MTNMLTEASLSPSESPKPYLDPAPSYTLEDIVMEEAKSATPNEAAPVYLEAHFATEFQTPRGEEFQTPRGLEMSDNSTPRGCC